jgi:hypothetical protein
MYISDRHQQPVKNKEKGKRRKQKHDEKAIEMRYLRWGGRMHKCSAAQLLFFLKKQEEKRNARMKETCKLL